MQVLTLLKKQTLKNWRAMWRAGVYIRDETNTETNKKIISNRKETPFPGISGGKWERTGLWLFSRDKERIGLGLRVGGLACPLEGGVIQQALADQWLTQAAFLPLTKGNLGITTWKPLFWTKVDQEKVEKRIALRSRPWVTTWSMTWVSHSARPWACH